jgi:hypothetical protein
MRKYYSFNNSKDVYYTGKDHRGTPNLINMQTGSEYFLPGYMFDEWELRIIEFSEISKGIALKLIPTPYGNHTDYAN